MMETVYLPYFGLSEAPFSITPDPAFVYLSQRHRDALAHLMYGVGRGGSGGFVQLTGEVGTGKTTLCRCVLEQVPDGTHVALILNPLMTPREMLESICDELGVPTADADTNKDLVDRLNAYLLEAHAAGERVVVVVDEAQNLSPESLEQIRLLTNLETDKHKLLQIVLLGQPELRDLLQRRSLRQLAQRITARFHLTPLSAADTARYVQHRMAVAGAERNPFRPAALQALYQRSGGIPRLINIIADRSLLAAYAREKTQIDARLVNAAADEVQQGEAGVRRASRWRGWATAAAVAAVALIAAWVWSGLRIERADDPERSLAAEAAPANAVTSPSNGSMNEAGGGDAIEPSPAPATSLDADWLDRQHGAAFDALAGLWGRPGDGEALRAACTGGNAAPGFACLAEEGNWALIRRLGLPVLLVLQGEGQHLLLLRGINDDAVWVGADAPMTVDRNAVETDWLGRFLVAWPQPEGWPNPLRRGSDSPAVDIVIEMAEAADPPYRGAREFNAAFETWLKAFQQRHGLTADGIVGRNTLLRLMAPTINEPRLATDWDASPVLAGNGG